MSSLQLALAAARAKSTYPSEPTPPPRNQKIRYQNRNATSMTRTHAPKKHIYKAETAVSAHTAYNSQTYNLDTTNNSSFNDNSKTKNVSIKTKNNPFNLYFFCFRIIYFLILKMGERNLAYFRPKL